MRAVCISANYCQYKTATGYCDYTGDGCAFEPYAYSHYSGNPPITTTQEVDISTESINKIAEAVVEKLRNCGARMENE